MVLTTTVSVWLPNPADITHLDHSSPDRIFQLTHQILPGNDMTPCGWLLLGTAKITYDLSYDNELACEAAAKQITQKMDELEASHQKAMDALREGLRNLQALPAPAPAPAPAPSYAPQPNLEELLQEEVWRCIWTGCWLHVNSSEVAVDGCYWGDLFYRDSTDDYMFSMADSDPERARCSTDMSEYGLFANADSDSFTTSYAGLPSCIVVSRKECVATRALTAYIESNQQ